jgi:hypothetical protein
MMKFKYLISLQYLFCLFFNFLFNTSIAQDSVLIIGRVIDSINATPIPFVNISNINNGNLFGVLTNENGEFQLNSNNIDSLSFSSIGYKTLTLSINSIINKKNETILLSPSIYSLNTILIKPNLDTTLEIIKKVIGNIKNNYNTTSFILEGYYREYQKENNKYGRLIEAGVSVYGRGYKNGIYSNNGLNNIEDFKITAFKKSNDYIKCFPEFKKWNQLRTLFASNSILYYDAPFNLKHLNEFVFKMDSIIYYENIPYYIIRFSSAKTTGTITVNSQNYSISIFEITSNYGEVRALPNGDEFSFKPRSINIKFEKFENKYFVSYIKYDWGVEQKRKSGTADVLEWHTEFMTNNIIRKNVIPFSKHEIMNDKQDLFNQYNENNTAFFDNGSILYPTELQKEIEKDINKRDIK